MEKMDGFRCCGCGVDLPFGNPSQTCSSYCSKRAGNFKFDDFTDEEESSGEESSEEKTKKRKISEVSEENEFEPSPKKRKIMCLKDQIDQIIQKKPFDEILKDKSDDVPYVVLFSLNEIADHQKIVNDILSTTSKLIKKYVLNDKRIYIVGLRNDNVALFVK